jgi:hypothetical protein
MNEIDFINTNQSEFLIFIKSKFTMIHKSNFFFRDFHYATIMFLEEHAKKISHNKAEIIAREVAQILEQKQIFKQIDHQSWVVNYPEFALPKIEKKVA